MSLARPWSDQELVFLRQGNVMVIEDSRYLIVFWLLRRTK
jgi:hypothetical protein